MEKKAYAICHLANWPPKTENPIMLRTYGSFEEATIARYQFDRSTLFNSNDWRVREDNLLILEVKIA